MRKKMNDNTLLSFKGTICNYLWFKHDINERNIIRVEKIKTEVQVPKKSLQWWTIPDSQWIWCLHSTKYGQRTIVRSWCYWRLMKASIRLTYNWFYPQTSAQNVISYTYYSRRNKSCEWPTLHKPKVGISFFIQWFCFVSFHSILLLYFFFFFVQPTKQDFKVIRTTSYFRIDSIR